VQPAEGEGALPIARPQHVQVAFERGGMAYVAVADVGFKAGDQIVVEGNERLRPGQPLMVKPAGEAAATKAP
jgi:hypothetical protein